MIIVAIIWNERILDLVLSCLASKQRDQCDSLYVSFYLIEGNREIKDDGPHPEQEELSSPMTEPSVTHFINTWTRASLVAQWLRICLLMQGTRVRALVWEDPTCRGATRPVSHNY